MILLQNWEAASDFVRLLFGTLSLPNPDSGWKDQLDNKKSTEKVDEIALHEEWWQVLSQRLSIKYALCMTGVNIFQREKIIDTIIVLLHLDEGSLQLDKLIDIQAAVESGWSCPVWQPWILQTLDIHELQD